MNIEVKSILTNRSKNKYKNERDEDKVNSTKKMIETKGHHLII